MKKLANYEKELVSLSAFTENHPVWMTIIKSCFFMPCENWKTWTNPWGTTLSFFKKDKNPKLSQKDIDFEKIKIWDIHFFEPFDDAVARSKWIFGGCLNSEGENSQEWIYLFDGNYCKLYNKKVVHNPMHLGYEMLKLHLDNPCQDKFKYKIPLQLKNWSNLFMEKIQ